MKIKSFLLSGFVFMLAACGGGGGGGSSSSSTSSYTGKGSTVLNLDWSTHTNPDGSSHQALTSSIILETAKDATVVPVTYAGSNGGSSNWVSVMSNTLAGMTSGQILNISAYSGGSTSATINAPANKPSVVVTISAGNYSTPTLSTSEVAALYNSAYNQNLIIVGALGSNGAIASYSSTAGSAADRFVVIDGAGTGSPYSGTSYSAPRIAGYAAIIKQKYPNATGEQIASAILNTAVLQPGWDPAIYGRGKADLTAALNYLGSTQ
jgi:hypothetical protein